MNATIVKRFEMECAHRLPNHDGKCRNLHGHSYKVDVAVRGPISDVDGAPDQGMVVDFAVIKDAWNRRIGTLDHGYLNDLLDVLPTAENIACWIFGKLASELDGIGHARDAYLMWVRVWEQDDAYAEASTS